MKTTKILFILSVAILLLQTACNSTRDTNLPGITGKSGEIIVVTENHRWQDTLGKTIRSILQEELLYLPQAEPMFSLIHIAPAQFGKIFQTHRNILFLKLHSDSLKPRISVRRNVWASPQLVMDMIGPSDTSLCRYILESREQITDRFNQAEKQRLISNARKYQDMEIVNTLKEKHRLSLYIPRGYSLDVDSADFAWISLESPTTTQGILIYISPYQNPNVFTLENMIRRRDRFLRRYVPGPLPGSRMATETILTPRLTEFEDKGHYFARLEGLWKLEGRGSMGGPFVSLTTVDEKRNRVVTAEGFVFAPGEEKRELLRHVEAIIYTLQIVE